MKKMAIGLLGIVFLLGSCEWLEENIPEGLTNEEIVEGLKTALSVGADTASTTLSKVNAYYGNSLIKIPLPEEAETVRQLITDNDLAYIINLDAQFENVVKAVNRAAEDAAREAAPIFKNAITGLSISQGFDILNGIVPEDAEALKATGFDSTAATQFLKIETYQPLTNLYAPKINIALDKDLGLGFSAVNAWETLTTTYNSLMGDWAVQLAVTAAGIDLPTSINSDLGVFSTQKALNGLFLRVGEEEKNIRRNPLEWITTTVGAILEKVFGSPK